ncbi:hypothetical protein CapIbe_013577 [Capra ibex]
MRARFGWCPVSPDLGGSGFGPGERRECVSGAPPKFPSCVPAPHHEAGSPSSSHPSQAACCYATWRVPLATSVP